MTTWFLPSLERPADLSTTLERPANLHLQFKFTDLILSFQLPCGSMNILFAPRIFLFADGYRNRFFSGNLLILSANGNNYHSIHRSYSLFCETTLLMLSCDRIESAKFIVASKASILQLNQKTTAYSFEILCFTSLLYFLICYCRF